MNAQDTDQKINAYYKEMKSFRNKVALGTKWEDIEPEFNDLHARLEQEPDEVQAGVAVKGMELAELAITLYGSMPGLVFNMAAKRLAKSMPTDLKTTKRSMDSVEKAIGDQMSPRIVFYYNAVRAMPDNDPANPTEILRVMREAYKIK